MLEDESLSRGELTNFTDERIGDSVSIEFKLRVLNDIRGSDAGESVIRGGESNFETASLEDLRRHEALLVKEGTEAREGDNEHLRRSDNQSLRGSRPLKTLDGSRGINILLVIMIILLKGDHKVRSIETREFLTTTSPADYTLKEVTDATDSEVTDSPDAFDLQGHIRSLTIDKGVTTLNIKDNSSPGGIFRLLRKARGLVTL
jgi:hypothetical protein